MKPGRLLHLLNGAGFGYCLGLTELLVSLGRCQTRRVVVGMSSMMGLLSHPFLKRRGERGREGDLTVLFAFLYGKRHVDEGWLGKARLLLYRQ